IARAVDLVRAVSEEAALERVVADVGTGVQSEQSIPAAFAMLALADGDPWRAAVLSANLGGDTDTIGAIAAGMAGARRGFAALPAARVAQLRGFDLAAARNLAEGLVKLRLQGGAA